MVKLATESGTRALVQKYRFRFKKSLGQNFLIDEGVLQHIRAAAQLDKSDLVVEIGPGIGTLTRLLAEEAGRVIAIELDKNLSPILKETLAGLHNVEIYWGDVLKTDIDTVVKDKTAGEFGPGARSYKVVANLPYYITTPIIMKFLEEGYNFESLVVMVQKEVAQRLVAPPGTKDCGAISVPVHYYTRAEMVTKVPKGAFLPPPEVESGVIKLTKLQQPAVQVTNEKLFFQLVRGAFAQRRKTLLNALANGGFAFDKQTLTTKLAELAIDPGRRGETLTLEEFAALANLLTPNPSDRDAGRQ